MTHVVLVSNPASGSSDEETLDLVVSRIAALGNVVRVEPESPEAMGDELSQAASDAEIVVVAGGDGTFNHAVNALRERLQHTIMGLIPMGTGNDLARTMGIPLEPERAAAALVEGVPEPLDVGIARSDRTERLFANACMGGFPVAVDEAIEGALKEKLGPFAFWLGGAKALADLTRYDVRIGEGRWDGLLALGVGNGKTAGGGITVFPDAAADDGRLDVVGFAADSVGEGAKLLAALRSGHHVDLPTVERESLSRLTVTSDPELEFNVDGELVGMTTPVEFEIFGSTRLRH